MAYLDLDNLFLAPAGSRAVAAPAPAAAGFSPLEWSVIALAQRDTLRSLRTPGPVARAMGGLFGRGTNSRLADPRLETLRRVAVHARRRGFAVPLSEIDRFVAAGFSEAQLETLLSSVTGLRIGRDGRRELAA